MKFFPIFADLHNKKVLVVGAGKVATRKIEALLKAGAQVWVVAEQACPAVQAWAQQQQIQLQLKSFSAEDLAQCWLVVAATDDSSVNQQVQAAAVAQCLWCNSVDDPQHSEFIMPAVVDRGDIQVAISSGGNAPVLARRLRAQIDSLLPQAIAEVASLMGRWRDKVKQSLPSFDTRRQFWERLLDSDILQRFTAGQQTQAEQLAQQLLDDCSSNITSLQKGHVSLVGAGPGDAELLTIKAQLRLQQADVIFYDALVDKSILERARRDAEFVYVGKTKGFHSVPQEEIQARLVASAQAGNKVVRLKGGDPFVFGRGGEELHALAEAGISFDVVPGITAAAAAAAYTGVALTHRDYAQSTVFVTGHGQEGGDLDWASLAKSQQTLAIYMGLHQSADIQKQLIEHGRAPNTPVAIIENASRPEQRSVGGQLKDLAQLIQRHEVKSPAIILVGEVCQQLGDYHWFGAKPLK
ncbi:siroheme synthase CysG [Dasania sp. GY-MA-18]|uniref:Siroheme synthase n=1 Tax=Dasania phycosphaerae TaxID=2950436 RepID=A0A9J6RKD2_9GAMM|nr:MULTISPECIES: siroheme synthase CysG [Dasania]MCR8922728.1 siroheme synthase CysG [Dasania sp. GY-MA-18]MCZ0865158.1 siroheme synthase CysG [Dasania phycosphaerae]MCZ0868884.1 siroheme synthase CysG [Dasania phycosphaerae]